MAKNNADEISKILREQIENYEQTVSVEEVGSIISVGDGIARVHGLEKAMSGEMLAFPHNIFGIALNLEEEQVGAVLLGESTELKEGDVVTVYIFAAKNGATVGNLQKIVMADGKELTTAGAPGGEAAGAGRGGN